MVLMKHSLWNSLGKHFDIESTYFKEVHKVVGLSFS